MLSGVELGWYCIAGAAGTVAVWVAALDHEPWFIAVERQAIEIALASKEDKAVDMLGRELLEELGADDAFYGVDGGDVHLRRFELHVVGRRVVGAAAGRFVARAERRAKLVGGQGRLRHDGGRGWGRRKRGVSNSQQFDIKDEYSIGRDDWWVTACAVTEGRWNGETPLAANAHGQDAFIPAFDNPSLAE